MSDQVDVRVFTECAGHCNLCHLTLNERSGRCEGLHGVCWALQSLPLASEQASVPLNVTIPPCVTISSHADSFNIDFMKTGGRLFLLLLLFLLMLLLLILMITIWNP
eukprot:GHVL01001361.1.p1 GENE.GHVL01001361.1~~GHVL01001361.1.p1  ORF type:complete len:107 (-),score=2.20 GHVL01001361.1:172-492(-)